MDIVQGRCDPILTKSAGVNELIFPSQLGQAKGPTGTNVPPDKCPTRKMSHQINIPPDKFPTRQYLRNYPAFIQPVSHLVFRHGYPYFLSKRVVGRLDFYQSELCCILIFTFTLCVSILQFLDMLMPITFF